MASSGKMLALSCLLFALCLVTEASPRAFANKRVNAPQKQTMVDFVPMNQMAGEMESDFDTDSVSSESSESSEIDMDTDMGINAAIAAGNNAAAAMAGAPAAGAPAPVAGTGNQIAGNFLPNTRARDQDRMFGRESGSTGQSVWIALAVVGLVIGVVVVAVFAIRRQRRSAFAA